MRECASSPGNLGVSCRSVRTPLVWGGNQPHEVRSDRSQLRTTALCSSSTYTGTHQRTTANNAWGVQSEGRCCKQALHLGTAPTPTPSLLPCPLGGPFSIHNSLSAAIHKPGAVAGLMDRLILGVAKQLCCDYDWRCLTNTFLAVTNFVLPSS